MIFPVLWFLRWFGVFGFMCVVLLVCGAVYRGWVGVSVVCNSRLWLGVGFLASCCFHGWWFWVWFAFVVSFGWCVVAVGWLVVRDFVRLAGFELVLGSIGFAVVVFLFVLVFFAWFFAGLFFVFWVWFFYGFCGFFGYFLLWLCFVVVMETVCLFLLRLFFFCGVCVLCICIWFVVFFFCLVLVFV